MIDENFRCLMDKDLKEYVANLDKKYGNTVEFRSGAFAAMIVNAARLMTPQEREMFFPKVFKK